MQLAARAKVTKGRKLRLDGTCVQTAIHHPTDSGLLVDSVRVLSRVVKRAKVLIKDQVKSVKQTCRSRLRSARLVAQPCIDSCGAKGKRKKPSKKRCIRSLSRRLSRWYDRPGAWSARSASTANSRPSVCSIRRSRCSPWSSE